MFEQKPARWRPAGSCTANISNTDHITVSFETQLVKCVNNMSLKYMQYLYKYCTNVHVIGWMSRKALYKYQSVYHLHTSSWVFGFRSPSVNVTSGCNTIPSASGRCVSAAVCGGSRVSRRRPRTTSPSGKMPEISLRGSPTPRKSSWSSRRWSWGWGGRIERL